MASVSISCPSCSATDGVVRNGSTADISYSCSRRKTWQLQFTYTASSQPGTHQKIIDMAMNGVGCQQPPALWALASTRFYVT
jgi:transposase-like protein